MPLAILLFSPACADVYYRRLTAQPSFVKVKRAPKQALGLPSNAFLLDYPRDRASTELLGRLSASSSFTDIGRFFEAIRRPFVPAEFQSAFLHDPERPVPLYNGHYNDFTDLLHPHDYYVYYCVRPLLLLKPWRCARIAHMSHCAVIFASAPLSEASVDDVHGLLTEIYFTAAMQIRVRTRRARPDDLREWTLAPSNHGWRVHYDPAVHGPRIIEVVRNYDGHPYVSGLRHQLLAQDPDAVDAGIARSCCCCCACMGGSTDDANATLSRNCQDYAEDILAAVGLALPDAMRYVDDYEDVRRYRGLPTTQARQRAAAAPRLIARPAWAAILVTTTPSGQQVQTPVVFSGPLPAVPMAAQVAPTSYPALAPVFPATAMPAAR